MGLEWAMARLMGVAMAKAELNNTVHLCSNQGCIVDFTPQTIPSCFDFYLCIVLTKVVASKAQLNNTVHLCSNLCILSIACLLYNLYSRTYQLVTSYHNTPELYNRIGPSVRLGLHTVFNYFLLFDNLFR
jgi:hypothetical protein